MSKQRSPNCPQITFEEAANKGRIVYSKEHTHSVPREAVANSLGYGGLNGRSVSLLGALRQYGILENTGDGLRVSEDAVTYFELEGGQEWESALERMAYRPQLFASLREQFGATLPSESTLKHHLIKLGFLPRAAEEVIEVYRENQKLVESMVKRYSGEAKDSQEIALNTQIATVRTPPPPIPVGIDVQTFSFALSPDTKADLHLRGPIGIGELELLKAHIDLTIRAWQMEGASIRRRRSDVSDSATLRLQSGHGESMERSGKEPPSEEDDISH